MISATAATRRITDPTTLDMLAREVADGVPSGGTQHLLRFAIIANPHTPATTRQRVARVAAKRGAAGAAVDAILDAGDLDALAAALPTDTREHSTLTLYELSHFATTRTRAVDEDALAAFVDVIDAAAYRIAVSSGDDAAVRAVMHTWRCMLDSGVVNTGAAVMRAVTQPTADGVPRGEWRDANLPAAAVVDPERQWDWDEVVDQLRRPWAGQILERLDHPREMAPLVDAASARAPEHACDLTAYVAAEAWSSPEDRDAMERARAAALDAGAASQEHHPFPVDSSPFAHVPTAELAAAVADAGKRVTDDDVACLLNRCRRERLDDRVRVAVGSLATRRAAAKTAAATADQRHGATAPLRTTHPIGGAARPRLVVAADAVVDLDWIDDDAVGAVIAAARHVIDAGMGDMIAGALDALLYYGVARGEAAREAARLRVACVDRPALSALTAEGTATPLTRDLLDQIAAEPSFADAADADVFATTAGKRVDPRMRDVADVVAPALPLQRATDGTVEIDEDTAQWVAWWLYDQGVPAAVWGELAELAGRGGAAAQTWGELVELASGLVGADAT